MEDMSNTNKDITDTSTIDGGSSSDGVVVVGAAAAAAVVVGGDDGGNGGTTTWTSIDGWKCAFGSNDISIALYRISLGCMLFVELITRFRYLHPFYSDEG